VAVGDSQGGAFTLFGQLGVQINDLAALYWEPGLMVDGWAAQGDDTDVFVFTSQLAMVDFTFGRAFQLGFGGGVDVVPAPSPATRCSRRAKVGWRSSSLSPGSGPDGASPSRSASTPPTSRGARSTT
jgi:hypothetical protein